MIKILSSAVLTDFDGEGQCCQTQDRGSEEDVESHRAMQCGSPWDAVNLNLT